MSEGILVKQILKIFGASRLKILNLSYKKTAKNEDSKKKMKKMKNIWWTMKKNAWKDTHPGENGESKADKNRWQRGTKKISIIQDAEESSDNAEESSDNDIILNCIEGDRIDDEDLPVIAFVPKLKII